MTRPPVAVFGALLLLAFGATTVLAGGMITAKETGAFIVGDQAGYPANTTFDLSAAPGSTVDSGIARLAPHASFGWHYHTAPVIVTVTAGTLTLYSSGCDRQVVTAGQGFIEEPNVVHLARNESGSLAVIAWTYVGVAPGQPEDVYKPADYNPCNGIQ